MTWSSVSRLSTRDEICEIKQRLASSNDLQRAHAQLDHLGTAGIPLVVTQHLTRGMLDWSRDNHPCCLDAAIDGTSGTTIPYRWQAYKVITARVTPG